MTLLHETTTSACAQHDGETDVEPPTHALPQRIPGAALAELMADFDNAMNALTAQRMPSRAEIEAVRVGRLAMTIPANPRPRESALPNSRILLAGDVHGNCSFVISLLDQARNHDCDRIVQVGDWGAWEHEPDGLKFVRDVEKHAAKRGIGIWWLDGNHDNTSLTLRLHPDRDDEGFHIVSDHVRYIPRGHRWTWYGVRFAAFGGAFSVDKEWRVELEQKRRKPGTLWFPEEEMADVEFYRHLADPAPVDVLLTHDKPRASNPGWNRKDLPECWPNQDRVQAAAVTLKPRLLVHGHLHYRYSQMILVGNDRWCNVEGLAADPDAMGRDYVKGESWMVLDLEKGLERDDA